MNNYNLLTFSFLIFLIGCSDNYAHLVCQNPEVRNQITTSTSSKYRKTVTHAKESAKRILDGHDETRTNRNLEFMLDYITVKNSTRTTTVNDTIAYIFNTEGTNGFAIISADTRLPVVLGFSETGYFDQTNPVIQENFTDALTSVYLQLDTVKAQIPPDTKRESARLYPPIIYKSIGQWNPYNKYVNAEHEGYPVGCVAIATAQIILYSTDSINYHGQQFLSKSIRSAFRTHEKLDNPIMNYSNKTLSFPKFEYEEAVDSLAKFLLIISNDLNMRYVKDQKVSLAFGTNARQLLVNLGLNVKTEYKIFNIDEVSQHLKSNGIIYIDGTDTDHDYGHAFLADGLLIQEPFDDSPTKEIFLHIDWGWEGVSNGYFNGEVFESAWGNYSPKKYFAVKSIVNPFLMI